MDSAYRSWHQQADALHYKVQDAFDQPDHRACQELKQQMRDLITDISQQHSPRDIEERIKGIKELFEPARNGSQTFMSVQDATTYRDAFERLRREVREHPHYS